MNFLHFFTTLCLKLYDEHNLYDEIIIKVKIYVLFNEFTWLTLHHIGH